MSSYKNENENNVQINPKVLSLVYTHTLTFCANLETPGIINVVVFGRGKFLTL